MTQLEKAFHYSGNEIRTFIQNEKVWFVAKDVCDVLDIGNSRAAVSRLKTSQKAAVTISDGSQLRHTTIINEAGVYKIIFKSKKEEAERFSDWVAEEVLPTIRKTGGFVSDDDFFIQTYLQHADDTTKHMFKSTLKTIRQQNELLTKMQPKSDYFDALVDRNMLTNFRDTSKELGAKEREFIKLLEEKKFVYRDAKKKLKPYAQYVDELFQLKEWARNGKASVQTLVTPKGRETFRLLLNKQKRA
ncbi:BRO family protein [Fictibacillus sp. S7]|uniref:BRO family protein n=1 Tax=Fictibacillus sp. S7 TaxID=2212476 RepID=UPI001012DC41|nr:BRO family protein [Fictibacillus sp. S7]RXZ00853.1 phage antirepressor Ant [Fictibacillus sp. S7]